MIYDHINAKEMICRFNYVIYTETVDDRLHQQIACPTGGDPPETSGYGISEAK